MGKNLGKIKRLGTYMIVLIMVFGFVLRLIGAGQSLWLDEAIGALVVRDMSLGQMFTDFFVVDNHPPLYYLLLKFWTQMFGSSEVSLRFPSILFGVATIYLVYLMAVNFLKGRKLGILAALLLATSQFHIYYSQEARMYSMAAFFAALSVYTFMRQTEFENKIKYWIIFSLSITALVATDYMPVFLLPVFFVYSIIAKKGYKWWLKLILSFTPLLVFGIIWFPIFLKQSQGGAWLLNAVPTWRDVAGGADIKQLLLVWIKFSLGRITIVNKTIYYIVIIFSSLPFIASFAKHLKGIKQNVLLNLWFFIPLLLSFVISFLIPAFIYFRFAYVIPAFYLIIASGILKFKNVIIKGVLYVSIFSINILSWTYYIGNTYQQREEWRQAVGFVENKVKPGEAILFSYPEPFAPYRWYEKKGDISFGATDSIYTEFYDSNNEIADVISKSQGIYYFEYLKDISDPFGTVINRLKNSGFQENEKIGNFNGVGYIYYFTK